ncbi:MAG: DNA primase [Aminipila sp.]
MSSSFNDNITEEIKSRCNIVDVIGQVVPLKRMGNNYKGVCPFHNEKTPSFVVSETKQIFTCFGCGATGDVFEFVKKYYNLDFSESVQRLAKEYGIQYENRYNSDSKNELYYAINKEAATYFLKAFCQKSNPGLTYMLKRGIEPNILKKFGIGYADSQWDSLYKHFMSKKVDVKILKELGLVSESKGKYYDKFRNRVMFPIINTRGKVIGFGGRAIGDDNPKYLNSPESPVFMKKNNLYGLNLSRQDISKDNCAILVEGYMDVISLYQSGIKNVGASLGTALTENQVKVLKRYTKNVVLSYDADNAGQAAALRGIDILFKEGCKPKVLHVTEGKDPDEFIKKRGRDAFRELVNNSLGFVDYKFSVLRRKYNIDSYEESIDFLKEAAAILKTLSPIEADVHIKKLANEIKISENAIRLEINGNNTQEETVFQSFDKTKEEKKIIEEISLSMSLTEKNLIKLIVTDYDYFKVISEHGDVFKSTCGKKIFSAAGLIYKDKKDLDVTILQEALEQEEVSVLTDIIETVQLADKEEQVLEECLHKIEIEQLKEKENSLLMRLSMADEEENQEVIRQMTEQLMELQKRIERGK